MDTVIWMNMISFLVMPSQFFLVAVLLCMHVVYEEHGRCSALLFIFCRKNKSNAVGFVTLVIKLIRQHTLQRQNLHPKIWSRGMEWIIEGG